MLKIKKETKAIVSSWLTLLWVLRDCGVLLDFLVAFERWKSKNLIPLLRKLSYSTGCSQTHYVTEIRLKSSDLSDQPLSAGFHAIRDWAQCFLHARQGHSQLSSHPGKEFIILLPKLSVMSLIIDQTLKNHNSRLVVRCLVLSWAILLSCCLLAEWRARGQLP